MSIPVSLYRFGNFFYKKGYIKIGKIISILNRFLFATWIPSSAEIGKNFKIGYGGLGVVIHSNTKIGNNCLIAQNVTIGKNFGDLLVPVIGNDVYIGAGSVVFGEIVIGDNVIIGSNSVVNKNIPNNCTVVGNPMRIIKYNRIEKYYEIS
ncbi:MAG: serine acetyltransferase [Candidatus Shapirobacteria bacterium]|nr:serine acetyltransferase [Candidatus Shapirobacteria bacterium]